MKFTGRYRFRLAIGLPLFVICFTLAAGFLPLGMLDRVPLQPEVHTLILNLKVGVLLITLVAAILAILISRYIIKPVETITKEIEDLSERHGNEDSGRVDESKMNDEIDRLSKLYQKTLVPMKGYLATADLFLQMSEGIVSLNPDGKIAFLNAPVERLLGIERQRYTGRHYEELFPNAARNFEIHELVEDVLKNGISRTRDLLISTPAGRDVYVRATASPATGRKKESIGVVMLFQDIEELSRLRDQLRRMDVLASIGSTIAGMAHEVKTPLGYIRGLAELIREDLPTEAPQMKYVEHIVESIDRLNVMVEEILSLASVKVDNSATHDPKMIVREAIMYVRDLVTANNLQLIEDYPQAPSPIRADRQKLVECFINILRNACEAAPEGAALNIRIRHVIPGPAANIDQDTLIFEFQNEGSYIAPEVKERLFTPFFTTKKKGTGLGLAISKQIIEAHGGAIQVESDPHSGTLFRILLPATLGKPPIPEESAVQ
jgi:two-component system sensor histidine kinase PilS (NtrC family)